MSDCLHVLIHSELGILRNGHIARMREITLDMFRAARPEDILVAPFEDRPDEDQIVIVPPGGGIIITLPVLADRLKALGGVVIIQDDDPTAIYSREYTVEVDIQKVGWYHYGLFRGVWKLMPLGNRSRAIMEQVFEMRKNGTYHLSEIEKGELSQYWFFRAFNKGWAKWSKTRAKDLVVHPRFAILRDLVSDGFLPDRRNV